MMTVMMMMMKGTWYLFYENFVNVLFNVPYVKCQKFARINAFIVEIIKYILVPRIVIADASFASLIKLSNRRIFHFSCRGVSLNRYSIRLVKFHPCMLYNISCY